MISVVIATKNREESLGRCIKALSKQSYRNFEVVIIGGAGKIREIGEIRVKRFDDVGKGLADARNFGWRKAAGAIVVFIDDDTEVSKDWLKNIVDTFKKKSIGGVTGPCVVPEEKLINRDVFKYGGLSNLGSLSFLSRTVGWIYKNIILEGRYNEIGKITRGGMWTPGANFYNDVIASPDKIGARNDTIILDVDYLEACNMAVRRDLIKKAGGFDLGFKGTSEWSEVDLAFRIRRLGYKLVFNPKVKLLHLVSQAGVYSARANSSERLKNFIRFYLKNRKMIWGEEELSILSVLGYLSNIFKFIMTVLFMMGYFIFKKLWKFQ